MHQFARSSATGDAILSVTYGITPKTSQDPFIRTPEEVMVIFADVGRGGYLGMFPHLVHGDDSYQPTSETQWTSFLS